MFRSSFHVGARAARHAGQGPVACVLARAGTPERARASASAQAPARRQSGEAQQREQAANHLRLRLKLVGRAQDAETPEMASPTRVRASLAFVYTRNTFLKALLAAA